MADNGTMCGALQINSLHDDAPILIFQLLSRNDRQQTVPRVCKRWAALSAAHAGMHEDLAVTVGRLTPPGWVQQWLGARAPHARHFTLQPLCGGLPGMVSVRWPDQTVGLPLDVLSATACRLLSLRVHTAVSADVIMRAGLDEPRLCSRALTTAGLAKLATLPPGLTRLCLQDVSVPTDMAQLGRVFSALPQLRDCVIGFHEQAVVICFNRGPKDPGFPCELCTCTQLTSLQFLSHTRDGYPGTLPYGAIPAEFGNLTALQRLVLTGSHCLETLPNTISRLQRLTALEVLQEFHSYLHVHGEEHLSFSLPSTLGRLAALTRLAVSVKNLGGCLLKLGRLRSLMLHQLQVLDRSGPEYQRHLMLSRLRYLTQLTELRISYAKSLTAYDVGQLSTCTSLRVLRLDRNHLHSADLDSKGAAARLFKLPQLVALDLACNCLATIPVSLQGATQLRFLDLSFNELARPLPTPMAEARRLFTRDEYQLEVLGLRSSQSVLQQSQNAGQDQVAASSGRADRDAEEQQARIQKDREALAAVCPGRDGSGVVVLLGGEEQPFPEFDADDAMRAQYMGDVFGFCERGPSGHSCESSECWSDTSDGGSDGELSDD